MLTTTKRRSSQTHVHTITNTYTIQRVYWYHPQYPVNYNKVSIKNYAILTNSPYIVKLA